MSATNSLFAYLTSLLLTVSPSEQSETIETLTLAEEKPQPASSVCLKTCDLSETGLGLIRTFEGYSPFVYKDSAGLDTIGYGHLIVKGEKFQQPLLPEQANELLKKDASVAIKGVNRHTNVKLKQNQFDALVSFVFNVGTGAYQKSTLLKRVNEEKHSLVPPQFLKWVYAGGKIIQGLVNRRQAEASLYEL